MGRGTLKYIEMVITCSHIAHASQRIDIAHINFISRSIEFNALVKVIRRYTMSLPEGHLRAPLFLR